MERGRLTFSNQHPGAKSHDSDSKFATESKCRLSRAFADSMICLDIGALECSIRHNDASFFVSLARPPQDSPANFLHEECSAKGEEEDMTRYVMATLPLSTGSLACHSRDLVRDTVDAKLDLPSSELAAATCPSETAIYQSRTKTPLRNKKPHGCNSKPSEDSPSTSFQVRGAGMAKHKAKEGNSDPGPASLDEKDVEQVGLARKVAWRKARVLQMRLRDVIVWSGSRLG
ncbi:unnamed protein product [Fusarium graminearum]|uniref:Chromosome 4, complete genome n=2 Tax=Gibberella zeae TaxID=5518 RepID=A0A098DQ42_GIBZE|nr:unnamed protein product [Fusarium graminearum]CAF3638437.1 unnamed protein product [Fusarium graminearum]CAG1990457.1 unnamed protein product [Fusarium graminearum]CAG1996153.1 unnamed protein product [Fusarium graminearum]CEF83960.1 unnamed protein product [Fusarium graminearum]